MCLDEQIGSSFYLWNKAPLVISVNRVEPVRAGDGEGEKSENENS